jgi:CBS domain-containing protein/uncharacterized protein YegP (UPF0339 family)
MMIYQLCEDPPGRWHWQLIGPDYAVLARSVEPYATEALCRDAINQVQSSWHAHTEYGGRTAPTADAARNHTVKEVMREALAWVPPGATLKDAARTMRDHRVGAVPVRGQKNGPILGIVTERDIAQRCVAKGADPARVSVTDVMTRPLARCHVDDDLKTAIDLISQKQQPLPVYDQAEHLVGMLGLDDVASAAATDGTDEVADAVSNAATRHRRAHP